MSDHTPPALEMPLLLDAREDWAARFGRAAPLEVEIGFGYGHFLFDYAVLRPELNLVGIEIRASSTERVATRARKLGLEHLVVFRGDARFSLPVLFAPESVSAFHIQFPDPWWKKRHHKRRLVDEDMVTLLHRLLVPGGRIHFRTDVLEYARASLATFEDGSGRLENLEGPGSFASKDPLGVPSSRERRYAVSGTPVYRLEYRKTLQS